MRALLKPALKLAVTLGVLAWLVSIVPLQAIIEALKGTEPGFVAIGLLAQLAMRLAAAGRIKLLADAQSLGLSAWRLLQIFLAANFYALLLPGTVAGGAATWIKYVQHGSAKDTALLVILANRGLALVTMLTVGLLAFALDGQVGPPAAAVLSLLAFLIPAAAATFLFLRPGLLRGLAGITLRLPGLRRMEPHLRGLTGRMARFAGLPTGSLVLLLLLSLGHELLGAVVMWAFAQALGLDLALLTVAWIRTAVQVVLMLPISVAGLGVREVTLVGLTAAQGIEPTMAVAWSLVIFAGAVAAALLGGLIELKGLWRRRDAATSAPTP